MRKLKLLLAACALFGVTATAWADTSLLTEANGWTKITSISQSDIANNYYVFVANDADLMLGIANSTNQQNNALFYQESVDPTTDLTKLFYLEANGTNYAMRNVKVDYLQFQTEWSSSSNDLRWRNNDQRESISWTGLGLEYLPEGAWKLTSTQYSRPLGIYNNGTGTPAEGNEIGANDADNGQKFQIYAIDRKQFATLLGAGATADSPVDMTGLIFNSDFENTAKTQDYGWTASNKTGGNYNFNGAVEAWHYGDFDLHQTLKVANGKYRVTVQAVSSTTAYVYAGSSKTYVTQAASGNFAAEKNSMAGDANYGLISVETTVTNGQLTFGIADPENGNAWLVFDNFKLYYLGNEIDLSDLVNEYESALAAAQGVDTSKPMNADVLSKLNNAKETYGNVDKTSEDALTEAITKLSEATTDANNGIAAYENAKTVIAAVDKVLETTNVYDKEYWDGIKAGYDNKTLTNEEAAAMNVSTSNAGNDRYLTTYTKVLNGQWKIGDKASTDINSGFYQNNWSSEGASDESNVTTPFFEYWVWDGNALGATTLSTTVSNLAPNGIYTVSMLARVRQQNDQTKAADDITLTLNDGDAINVADGQQSSVSNFEAMYHKEVVAVGTADAEGKLVIALNVKEGNHISWLAFKNVNVTEFKDIKLSSIVLDQTDATLTTGDELTLTVTSVSPDNADDKTYSWSSTDESVAMVTNGKVVALAAGSATIKATANDGGGAEGTCTITVEDAAAPTNWSDIADVDQGDFFIRNVGTGKFLGGANSWGSQASLIKHGIPFGLVNAGEGVYTLDSYTYTWNGDLQKNLHHFNGTYVDGESTNIYVTKLSNGNYALSTADGSAFVTAHAGNTVVDNTATSSDASLAQWQFLSADDMLKNLEAGETDATFFLSEANISRNLRKSSGASAWVGEFAYGGNNDNQCAERYHGVTNVYQTISVPNGTYKVRAQGFYRPDDGSADASYLFANNEKTELNKKEGTGDPNSMGQASNKFSAGEYWNEVEVKVSDNKLTVGIMTDDKNNWTIWDNFELVLTDKTGLQGTESSVDAYLTADNGTTYVYRGADSETQGIVSATNELYATITTSIAGISTITFKDKLDKNGLWGERLFLSNEDGGDGNVYTDGKRHVEKNYHHHYWKIEGNKLRNIEYGKYLGVKNGVLAMVSAEDAAEWTFDPKATETELQALKNKAEGDTHVFGFEEGEYAPYNNIAGITAVAEGAAIDVTKDYPSLKIAAQSAAFDDAWTANSEEVNAFYDGSFGAEYSHDVNVKPTGWTGGTNHDNANDVRYMWQVEQNPGLAATTNSTALFTKYDAYYGKAVGYTMPLKANTTYKLTFKYGTWGTGDDQTKGDAYVQMEDGNANTITINPSSLALTKEQRGANASVEKWYEFTGYFTTTDAGNYVLDLLKKTTNQQNQYVYGDIVLKKATGADLKEALQQEIESTTVANVGTGIFQRPAAVGEALTTAKGTAQGVYDKTSASYDEVKIAIEDLKTAKETYNNAELNAPDASKLYNIIVATDGHGKKGNAIMSFLGTTGDNNPTGYGLNANFAANPNLTQAFTFTKVEGNTYNISFESADGTTYLTYGANNGSAAGWKNSQIQATTVEANKGDFLIKASDTEGVFNIVNTLTSSTIACQNGGNIYTENGNADFQLAETTKPSITINTKAAGYGTTMLPFAVASLPEGVKVYTCAEVSGNTLTLDEVTALEANKPYIIEGAWEANLTGDAQGTALTYTDGLLTGVYAEKTDAPVGSYVLQNQESVVGFYKVAEGEGKQPKVKANHAYLTVTSEARALYFNNATAIRAIEALTSGEAEIYNAAGARQNSLQKGVNIIKQGGKTVKVMVK